MARSAVSLPLAYAVPPKMATLLANLEKRSSDR
jgi:hypothetical protein